MLDSNRIYKFLNGRESLLAYIISFCVVFCCWVLIFRAGSAVKSLDEPDFLQISQVLAETGMFALEPGTPTAYRAPGLVFYLAPLTALGADLMQARLANALLAGGTLILLFHLIRRQAGPVAGLFAVLMMACWPVMIYAATTLYPQTLAAFLLVATLLLADFYRSTGHRWLALLAGLVFGAAILTVPLLLLLSPILWFWVFVQRRRGALAMLLFAAVSAAVVCSWTLRNYNALGGFVPVATSSGFNLLAGNTAQARWNTSLNVRFPEYVYTEMTGKTELQRNSIMTKAAFKEIQADEIRFVKLYMAKFAHWFHFQNRLLSDTEKGVETGALSLGKREAVLFASWLLVLIGPLACRLWMLRQVPFRRIELLFLALWVFGGMAYALFFTRIRFRLPFDWLVISSNAIFVSELVQRAISKHISGALPPIEQAARRGGRSPEPRSFGLPEPLGLHHGAEDSLPETRH